MALMDLLPSRRKVEVVEPPAPPVKVSHKGRLFVGGMFPVDWDTADPISVERARSLFRASRSSGFVAMSYGATKSVWGGASYDGEVIRDFDPEADEIRMSLPYAGG